MRLLFILLLLLPLWPTSANAQTTRAIFVGIDSYQFSTTKNARATFKDLRGAPRVGNWPTTLHTVLVG